MGVTFSKFDEEAIGHRMFVILVGVFGFLTVLLLNAVFNYIKTWLDHRGRLWAGKGKGLTGYVVGQWRFAFHAKAVVEEGIKKVCTHYWRAA